MKKVAPGKKQSYDILQFMLHMFYELYIYVYELKNEQTKSGGEGVRDTLYVPMDCFPRLTRSEMVAAVIFFLDLVLDNSPRSPQIQMKEPQMLQLGMFIVNKDFVNTLQCWFFFQDNFVFFIDNVLDSKHYTSREIGIKL